MTLEELYKNINGDYESVFARIPSEALINKFLIKFLNDETFNNLQTNLNNKDYKEAFRSVHTLKGICLNMSFDGLFKYVNELTETLRNADETLDENLVNDINSKLIEQYNITINSIKNLN